MQGECEKDIRSVNGQTPMHLAVEERHYKCLEALINNGADVNAQDRDGDTNFHLVIMKSTDKEIKISLKGMLRSALDHTKVSFESAQ